MQCTAATTAVLKIGLRSPPTVLDRVSTNRWEADIITSHPCLSEKWILTMNRLQLGPPSSRGHLHVAWTSSGRHETASSLGVQLVDHDTICEHTLRGSIYTGLRRIFRFFDKISLVSTSKKSAQPIPYGTPLGKPPTKSQLVQRHKESSLKAKGTIQGSTRGSGRGPTDKKALSSPKWLRH